MDIKECENLNQLRLAVRTAWNKPHDIKNAMILKFRDRFETVSALRTFATELGARAIILDIQGSLTDEQRELLNRRGPRIVVIADFEKMPKEERPAFPAAINTGGRAFPIFLWPDPAAVTEQAPSEMADSDAE